MKLHKTKKNVPLLSSQSEHEPDIEQKVDRILDVHAKFFERKQHTNTRPEDQITPAEDEPRSRFKDDSKKKTAPIKGQGKEKKSTTTRTRKRIGIKQKKKEHHPLTTTQDPSTKSQTTEEDLPHFQESIAQIKTEEATWLDQQIKAKMNLDLGTQPDSTDPSNVEEKQEPRQTQEPPSEQSPSNIDETIEPESEELPPAQETETPSYETPTSKQEVLGGLVQETTPPPQVQQEVKLDEIIPDGKIRYQKEASQLKAFSLERMGYAGNDIEEIDFYPINEPFSYVQIIREKESLDKRYVLIEMQLTKDEEYLLKFIKETLDGFAFNITDLEAKGEDKYLSEKVELIINDYMLNIDTLTKKKILYYLEKESIGLGKLDVIMKDPNIEDISCDGSGVFIFLYHRRYGSLKSNVQFNDEEELTAFVVKLAQKCGKHISISEPMLDATMPDGSRIQMTLSTEVTTKGSTFTIRKFSEDPFSPPDLIEFHTMSSEMVAYMWLAVENGINALIAGGTAAGKTSTLNALCLFIPRESKIVSIEETREINLPHPNWIPGVVRSGFGEVVGNKVIGEIDLYDLMKAALRQRPEYILVGEIRGKEAYVLFQAMATGHTTYSTFHADSAQSLIHRLEGKPIEIPRVMLQSLDIVTIQVQVEVGDKRVRRCKQIVEIVDIDPMTKEILTNEVFRWDPVQDQFFFSGKSYVMERIRTQHGYSKEDMLAELNQRVEILEWLRENNIRAFKDVARIVSSYLDTPDEVMEKVRKKSQTNQKEQECRVEKELVVKQPAVPLGPPSHSTGNKTNGKK
jgi:type IV secretory pathway ATPase VirB11/archaellum biosynthesis ATPase